MLFTKQNYRRYEKNKKIKKKYKIYLKKIKFLYYEYLYIIDNEY